MMYTDELWINTHNTKDSICVDSDGKGGWEVPSGKGQKLIVVNTQVEGKGGLKGRG